MDLDRRGSVRTAHRGTRNAESSLTPLNRVQRFFASTFGRAGKWFSCVVTAISERPCAPRVSRHFHRSSIRMRIFFIIFISQLLFVGQLDLASHTVCQLYDGACVTWLVSLFGCCIKDHPDFGTCGARKIIILLLSRGRSVNAHRRTVVSSGGVSEFPAGRPCRVLCLFILFFFFRWAYLSRVVHMVTGVEALEESLNGRQIAGERDGARGTTSVNQSGLV